MKPLSLKTGILAAVGIGFAGVVYVIIGAFFSASPGPLDSYARGEMFAFRTVSNPPAQPLNRLVTGDGEDITLADKRGKIVLVNFWATWCPPCVAEMADLNALQSRYGSQVFEVVAISMDRTIEEPREFLIRHDLNHLDLYFDPGMSMAFNVMGGANRGLPLTVIYDRNGREIGRLSGEAKWAGKDARRLIEAILERY